MGTNSNIQWTDHTINFWTGCKKVDSDCKFCYMYRDKERYGLDPKEVVMVKDSTINAVLKKAKPGDKIFTCSWSDFFIEEADEWRDDAWNVIRSRPDLIWQILTKRPERILNCLPEFWNEINDRVWLGTSIGSFEGLDRLNGLVMCIANSEYRFKTLFLSVEPLHEKLMLRKATFDILGYKKIYESLSFMKWVIIGGESGNDKGKYKYRECKIEWIEQIIADCRELEIPVFVKQLGTYLAKELGLKDRHGGDESEWPQHLRIRQFPRI